MGLVITENEKVGYSRRSFLHMLGGVAGASLVGLSPRAQADCLKEINLELRLEYIEGDLLSEVFFSSDLQSRQAIGKQIMDTVRSLYTDHLQISVKAMTGANPYRGQVPEDANIIQVLYTTIDTYLNTEHPDFPSLLDYAKRSLGIVLGPAKRALLLIPGQEYEQERQQAMQLIREHMKHDLEKTSTSGLAVRDKKRIYIFPREDIVAHITEITEVPAPSVLGLYNIFIGANISHEIGHVLGLGHSSSIHLPDESMNIMSDVTAADEFLRHVFNGAYSFSDKDKQKIQAQFCR